MRYLNIDEFKPTYDEMKKIISNNQLPLKAEFVGTLLERIWKSIEDNSKEM